MTHEQIHAFSTISIYMALNDICIWLKYGFKLLYLLYMYGFN